MVNYSYEINGKHMLVAPARIILYIIFCLQDIFVLPIRSVPIGGNSGKIVSKEKLISPCNSFIINKFHPETVS